MDTPLTDAAASEQANSNILWQLQQANAEVERLAAKVDRLLKMESSLEEALRKAKADHAEARSKAVHAEGESKFNQERVDRLQEAMKSAQAEIDAQLTRIMDGEKRILALQQTVSERDDALLAKQDELRGNAEEFRRRGCLSPLRRRRRRARSTNGLLQAAVKRKDALEESMRRVETGLSGRLEEDKVQLSLENDALKNTVETLRKQSTEKSAADQQRLKALEDEARTLRAVKSDNTAEIERLKQELVREEEARQAAAEKCALVEDQLSKTSDKLVSLETKSNLDAVKIRENEKKALELEDVRKSLTKAESELETAQEQAANFRSIALSTSTMKELKEASLSGRAGSRERRRTSGRGSSQPRRTSEGAGRGAAQKRIDAGEDAAAKAKAEAEACRPTSLAQRRSWSSEWPRWRATRAL